jgi:H/ACA ribonucleoprotein complex subunit 4
MLLTAGKEYVCLMHVHAEIPEDKIRKTVNEFVGIIKQRPPVKSAVKRVTRERRVYSIDILEIKGKDVLFKTDVQAGTYIRKLCSDIGKKLGCGAHMAELRRTRAGPFNEDVSVTLHQLADAWAYWKEDGNDRLIRKVILPVETAVEHLPKVVAKDGAVNALCYGSAIAVPGIVRLDENIDKGSVTAIFTLKGELIALGTALMSSSEIAKAKKGWAIKTDRVVLPKDTYPRMW